MKINIKNMRGKADINAVAALLNELNLAYEGQLMLGEVNLNTANCAKTVSIFKKKLEEKNFHIIFDRKNILTEQVKHLLYKMFETDELPNENYSAFISKNVNLNYNYVANVFSEMEGITIEHFIIQQKIGRAKELLRDTDMNISQIADALHYSSIGHFSNQFKKLTGITPTTYKKTMDIVEV